MQHWCRPATDGTEFWISCKWPAFLSGFSQTCTIAILGSLNPAPYWRFFFQMLFRLFQSWKSQILAKPAWIANWQYLLVLDTIHKALKKLSQPKLSLSKFIRSMKTWISVLTVQFVKLFLKAALQYSAVKNWFSKFCLFDRTELSCFAYNRKFFPVSLESNTA